MLALAAAHPEVARRGVLLRRFGQEIIRVSAGKRVHGTGSVPGGVNRCPTPAERDALAAELPQVLDWCEEAVDLIERMRGADPLLHERFGRVETGMLSLVAPDGGLDLYHGALRARDAAGKILFDQMSYDRYWDRITEEGTSPP